MRELIKIHNLLSSEDADIFVELLTQIKSNIPESWKESFEKELEDPIPFEGGFLMSEAICAICSVL